MRDTVMTIDPMTSKYSRTNDIYSNDLWPYDLKVFKDLNEIYSDDLWPYDLKFYLICSY